MAEFNTRAKPEIRVFAGPNGSGKSTITRKEYIIQPYINADEIKQNYGCGDLEAAQMATEQRELAVAERRSFTFETVLSTDRNLILLENAKAVGYFIRCSFVLTVDPSLNVERVRYRVHAGGHNVPQDKVISRYYRSLSFIPRLREVCDRLNIYDNSLDKPFRIFKKRDEQMQIFRSDVWYPDEIVNLVTLGHK